MEVNLRKRPFLGIGGSQPSGTTSTDFYLVVVYKYIQSVIGGSQPNTALELLDVIPYSMCEKQDHIPTIFSHYSN